MDRPIIGLLTDFGDEDFFVPSLKGVIAQINPDARIIDVTHRVPSFNVIAGSFLLFAAYRYFPERTIFLAVVDPGVGSVRKILCAETEKYYFIGPDNGMLSMALDEEKIKRIIEVAENEYFLPHPTHTFEARDKMAPVAAWVSKGTPCEKFGPEIVSYKRLDVQKPERHGDDLIGAILHIDKFGNLITNVPVKMLAHNKKASDERLLRLRLARGSESGSPEPMDLNIIFRKTYGEAKKGEALCLSGSLGLIEIAIREGSASACLKARVGDRIILTI